MKTILEFRNVEGSPMDPVETWPYEGLVEVLERGLIQDWRPVFAELRARPWGQAARRVRRWAAITDDRAAAALFTAFLERSRQQAEARERDEVAERVRRAVDESGLTAADFAANVGTSASRLSTYATGRVVPSAAMLVRIEAAGQSTASLG